ncbi:MAG: 4-hydroxy-3-methylbut-2-enyl diphosphate reductase [Bacteroidia bacterium]|nr:4-hydroxy-3-methylbut-2-enyl diphosphate reductase [Bacteroidia bacterium]MCF8426273.1 4-hydroxy-3-methylbut-2-enyl diphosphate reductase [Bacteroidia bacterium]MCF8445478.1 4-hydroxy-3-methylbut-2-enyl diphosphate reductase [Bacteroidia bacterium]
MNLNVEIDDNSGFCFGVVFAIQMAEDILNEEGHLFCLGDIVHNDEEVARLKAKGLEIIDHDKLKTLTHTKVLIRAHGEPPETYKLALDNMIELVDASCPVVLKLQNRVREASNKDEKILIYGKHGHAEVKGLVGQTNGEAIVIESFDELDQYELPSKIQLFSQTTKRTKNLYALKEKLESQGVEVNFNDTLCRQVSNRDIQLRDFARKFDVVIFVAGLKSSNGKVLFDVCKEHNPNTYFISNKTEINPIWIKDGMSVGVCGATSTPHWQMEEVKTHILEFCDLSNG